MHFEFTTAGRIEFGSGKLAVLKGILPAFGTRVFLVSGKEAARAEPLLADLKSYGITSELYNVSGEPTLDVVQLGVDQARDAQCDFVVGMGGGSVLDTGKAISALLTNTGQLMDYLEVVGRGQPLMYRPLPYIAIPTTAGTGTADSCTFPGRDPCSSCADSRDG